MRILLGSALVAILFGSWAVAGPQGEHVIRGNVTFDRAGNTTTIHASNRSIIHYSGFDIARRETVRFVQPSATSTVLNRIRSAEPTRIDGALRANGIVYLVNRAGVIFGPGSVVDVAGIYAAAASISNADFVAGINRFTDCAGAVVNYGQIVGSSVNLIGRHVANHGSIVADNGLVTMVAGKDVLLTEEVGGHVLVKLEGSAEPAGEKPGVENTGSIQAEKGSVLLAAGDMFSLAARSAGSIQAKDVTVEGQAGVTEVSGSIDASDKSPGGKGGKVKVLGEKVALKDADIDASGSAGGGEVLVGGDLQGGGDVPTAQFVFVTRGTTIRADAADAGDGGKVIVWADQVNRTHGRLSARGGSVAGDGGLIETSGKKLLVVTSVPEPGRGGTWLLDPESIDITGAQANITQAGSGDPGPVTFDPTAIDTVTTIDVANINAALDAGSNVTINTASGGTTTNGTITVTSNISKTADGGSGDGSTLTLNADADIVVDGTIGSTTGVLNVDLNAGLTSGGAVDINNTITTNGGTFASSGSDFDNTGGAITTGGGTVTIDHSGTVTVGANIDSGAGAMSITSGNDGSGNLSFGASVTLTSDSIALRAGNDGGTATAVVDATTNTPTFENAAGAAAPGTFTLRQDAAITDATLPAETQFTGGASPAAYNIQSDDAGVSLVVNAKIAGSAVTVTGLTGGDAYQIDAAAAGQAGSITLNAGAGDDTLTIDLSAGSGLPSGGVTFNGEAGTGDTLALTEGTNAWNITGGSSGTVTGVAAWSTVENLTGGSDVDTFTLGAGSIASIDGGGGNDVFNMDGGALTGTASGGAGDDTFDFADGVTIAGGIDGGAGTDTLDLADSSTARTVALTNVGATDGFDGTEASITGGFDNIDEVIGSSGATTDSLTGIDAAAAWGIDGSNQYTSTNTLAFSNFETLTGGSDVDTFTLDTGGEVTDLNGGGGDDIFDLNGGTLSGTAAGDAGDDTFTIGTGAVFAGACAGGAGTNDTLVKVDGGAWGISGSGSGSVNGLDGGWTGMETLTGGTAPDTFVVGATGVITNLNGGAQNDTFDLSATGGTVNGDINGGVGNDTIDFGNGVTVGGSVDGGAGTDTLNFAAYTTGRNFTLSSAGSIDGLAGDEAAIGGTFDNIDVIVGGTAGDSLTGMTTGAGAWVIDGGATETYTGPAGTLTFSSIETLDGGDGVDTFTLSGSGSIANFNGNAGDDIFNLNGGTMTGTMSGGAGDDTFNIGAGASFAGACDGGAGSDTLTKADGTNAWNITGAGSGTVTGLTGGWSNMETLTGGTGVDTFTLPGAGSITNLNGGDNADVFNFNGGALTGTASGGAGDDTFDFADGGAIAGGIDGGAGTDTLDFADYATAQSVTLSGAGTSNGLAGGTSITGTFDNINVIAASTAAGDSLTGIDAAAAWGIDGTNQYTSTNTLAFSNFETLTGGSDVDTFTLSAGGSVTDLNGGDNADVFNFNGGALTGTASGGAGDDTFDFADTVTIAGGIDGGAGSDTIDWADYGSARAVTLTNVGATDGFDGTEATIGGGFDNIDAVVGAAGAGDSLTGIDATATWALDATNTYTSGTNTLTFSNIEDLTGGTGADTFDFADAATVGGAIDGAAGTDTLDWADYASARAVVVTGTGATDGFDGTEASITGGFANIDGAIGGSATTTDSLSGTNSAATWSVDGTDQYTTSGRTLDFGNVNVLNGGSDDDALTIDFSGGNPIPTGGLTFNGGGQALNDSLTLQGSSPATVTHTFDTATTGDIDVTGSDTITYTGLEPITDNLSPTDRVFTFNNTSADTIVVGDEGTADNNISEITSGVSETVTFTNPTGSLTINTGAAGGGSDTVTVHLDTQGGAEFGGDLNIGSTEGLAIGAAGVTVDGTTGIVRINAGAAVTQSGTVTATALGVLANGAITLTQSNDVDTFAAESTAASAAVQLTDTGDLSIGTVADAGGFFGKDLVGIVTSSGDVTVTCVGDLNLTNLTDAGGGAVQFETTGSNNDIVDDSTPVDAVDVTGQSVTWITSGGSGDVGKASDDIEISVTDEYVDQVGGKVYTISAGDRTIHISGTYSSSASVTAGFKLTVDGTGSDVILDAASLSCIDGEIEINCNSLTVQNATTIGSENGLIDINCDTFALSNGTIESGLNSTNGAIEIDTTGVLGTGNVSITGGEIISNGSGDIQITSAGSVSLSGGAAPDGTITAGTGEIFVTSAGGVADTGATPRLIGPDLRIDAAAGIGTSGDPLNTNVNNLAVRNTTSGGIHIQNSGALDIGGGGLVIDGTNAVVESDSAVDGFIRASTPLTISLPATHNGSFTYQAGDDEPTAGDTLTINADVTLTSATDSTLAFVAGDDIDQTGGAVSTGGGGTHTVVMWADHESHAGGDGAADGDRGHINQTGGSLAADNLLFSAEEAVTLRQVGNDLATISGQVNGPAQGLAYEDADGLTVASGTMTDPDGGPAVNLDGILTNDGDLCLVTGDWLNIMNPIAVGAGTVRINSGGTVDQAGTGTITADGLGILSVDTVVLELGNDVNTLSAEVTTNGSGLRFSDADDLTVGAVADAAPACLGQALDGVLTDEGDVCLASGDWLSITNPIQTGFLAAGTVWINSGGTVDQSGTGTITAPRLGVLAVDTVILELGNNVGTLAGKITTNGSGFHFTGLTSLTVGAVADAVPACLGEDLGGILTNSGDVCLATGDWLDVTNPITAAAGTVRINSGGTVDQSGTGTITANELGILSVDTVILELGNDVGTLAAKITTNGSDFHFTDADDLTVGAVLDAVAPAETCLGEDLDGILTDDGDVCLATGDWLDVTNPIQTSATAAAGTVRINSGGTVNQSATGTITAQRLGVLSVDTVILELGNDVDTLAGRVTTGGSGLHFSDADDLTVGAVEDAVGPAEPCLGEDLDGILTDDGDVCLATGDWLNITNPIRTSAAAAAGTVRINSGGTVNQSATGTITAQNLGVLSVDTVILELGNDVNTLAGKVTTNASDFHFNDADDLTVGAVSDAIAPACLGEDLDGILTDDGDVCLAAGDWVNITNPIQTSAAAAAGTVRINSGGTLDQAGTGTITADALGVLSVDTVTLELANNNVTTLAGEVTTAGAGLLFREADGLTIGTVADATPACLGQALPGLVTNNGTVRMRTGGAIAQTADVTAAGFGAMTAGGNVTLDRNGNAIGTYAVRTQSSTGDGGAVTLSDEDGLTIGTVTDSGGLFGGSLVGINTSSSAAGGVAGDVDLQLPGTVDGSVLLILDNILASATGAGGTAGNVTMATSNGTIALEQQIGAQWYPYYRPRHVIRFGDGTAGKTIWIDALGPGGNGAILVNDLTRTFSTAPLANSVPTGDEGMGMASIWGKVASNGAVIFRSGYFAMGPNEKFTSLGSIYIQTSFGNVPPATLAGLPAGAQSRDARVSDLTAATNLVVNASGGRVDLQGGRGADNLVAADASANYRTIVGDTDVAFLAGGQLSVFGSQLNMPVGFIAADVDGGGGAWGIQFLGSDLNLLLAVPSVGIPNYDTSSPGRAALAIAAETTLPTRGGTLATALASALPEEEIKVTMESTVAPGQREDLVRHLGIFTKDPNDDELVDFLCGRRFFMDTPEFVHVNTAGRPVPEPDSTSPSQHKASIDRLPGALGREGLASYRALYWRQKVDPKTGRKTWIPLAAQIRDVLGKSITAYKAGSKGKFDPVAYRKWLSKKADQKEARELMARLSSLFRQVELLGLGPVELANSHRMLARSIKPRGVSVEQLIDAVKASPRGKEVAATAKK